MSLTFFGWLFVALAIPVLLHFLMGTRGLRKSPPELESCRIALEDIGARLKSGKLTDAEADAARLALLSRSPRGGFSSNMQGRPIKLLVASSVILLVSGIGAAVSYDRTAPEAMRPGEMIAFSEPDGEMLARLTDYARSIDSGQPSARVAAGEPLPDVNAMIERLAARLESTPQDLEGWRMLGWSYFHTERYGQAVAAFERALKLDPGSAELRLSYEEARAKASAGENLETTPSLQTEAIDRPAQRPASEPGLEAE